MDHSYFRVMSYDKSLNIGHRLPNDGDFHGLFNNIKNFLHKDENYTIRYKGLDIYPDMKVGNVIGWKRLYDHRNPKCDSRHNAMTLVLRLSEMPPVHDVSINDDDIPVIVKQTTAFKAKELKANIESRKQMKKTLEDMTPPLPNDLINKIMLFVPYNITPPPCRQQHSQPRCDIPRNTTWLDL
jgi:hypothetical protein